MIVFSDLSPKDADVFGLVLASEQIVFDFKAKPSGLVDLVTGQGDMEKAFAVITLYLEENKATVPLRPVFPERFHKTYSGLFVSVLLLVIHARVSSPAYRSETINRFAASAELILQGEIHRCATALFLHGDDMHLLGNMAGIAFFGTAVISLTGPGLGWLMIVLSGMAGNGINAWFFQSDHVSIGASTAVFGAVGILAAIRFIRLLWEKGVHINTFLPLGAGLALLGLLGSSTHTDISAHLFGYLSGLILGSLYAMTVRHPFPDWLQTVLLFITTLILAACFYISPG